MPSNNPSSHRVPKQVILARAFRRYRRDFLGQNISCCAFNEDVYFTRKFWNHISHKDRDFNDVYRRIKLIPYIKRVLSDRNAVAEIRLIRGIERLTVISYKNVKINASGTRRRKRIKFVTFRNKYIDDRLTALSVSSK